MKPVRPDEALGAIVGHQAQSRPELLKRIWKYIKSHELQDRDDGRVIHPDRALKRVLGNKQSVSMLEIPRGLNAHVRAA